MINTKKAIGIFTAFVFTIQTSAFASILGSESVTRSKIDIGPGATLFTNSFYSDQSGVGLQTENFVEYTPNSTLVPVVINDTYLYGKSNISNMASSLSASGLYPVMLMNSDFFSFKTGVPMSHQVSNGVLVTKDSSSMDAIGINKDGSAFISWLTINTAITVGEHTISIDNFNKYRQPYVIYMLDDKFGKTTKAEDPGLNVVIGSLDGELTLGSSVKGVVEQVIKSDGEIEIPKGKIVLTVDDRVSSDIYSQLDYFSEGDEVIINTTAEGDSRWNEAKDILGCFGGRLIKDGNILDVDESAAPRSAFGIKADGTLVFYTIDGRQSGYSYGVRLNTLAKRMQELGCVDAVNLDGGGSTSIGGIYPGNDNFSIINKPSDGNARQVSTFIGLLNTAKSSGNSEKLFLYPYGKNYLSGATQKFNVLSTDSNYYKSAVEGEIVFTAPDGTQSTNPEVKITGNGEVSVIASSGNATGSISVNCYETPDKIIVYNQDTQKVQGDFTIRINETVNLTAAASLGHKELIADDGCFEWEFLSDDENVGTIDSNGYFTAGNKVGKGIIKVSAGRYSVSINVNVTSGDNGYTDINFENPIAGQVKIVFSNADNVEIDESNISVVADGDTVDYVYSDNCINLIFNDNLMHKIKVGVKNNADLYSEAYYTLNGEEYENNFSDIDTHWAKPYITYMNNKKIVSGVETDGKYYFNPSDNVTRAEFAVMIANMMNFNIQSYSEKELKVDDSADIPNWAVNHVKALVENGYMNGRQDGSKVVFDAYAKLTRAEAVTVLSRILNEKPQVSKAVFTDSAAIPDWADEGFNKLYSLKIISGYDDGSVKPLNTITRAEAIKLIYEIY